MNRVQIDVPDMQDSFSRVVLDSKAFLIRFSWNEFAQRWSFGLFTMQKEPIVQGIRMVPRFPLNLQIVGDDFPQGVFGVYTDLEAPGRQDFVNGRAIFAYIPPGQEA